MQEQNTFSSTLPITLFIRPTDSKEDWRELDHGPGYFQVPEGCELRIRIKSIDDQDLFTLVQELHGVDALRFLDLAENRNITNAGMAKLPALPQITGLNLSSVSISNSGLEPLRQLPRLSHLNLSYCNRLSDVALKTLEAMRNLVFVDLQGCLGITKGGLSRIRRRSLQIYR